MRKTITFTVLLALALAIVTEVSVCIGAYEVKDRPDSHPGFMAFVYALHGPGEWAMYKIFPVKADMDDHVTGLEGGFEDDVGDAIFCVVPVLLLWVVYIFLIGLFMMVWRVRLKFSGRAPQLQL
jgi:hypothetical protein